jgi:hypothetical protein
MCGPRRFGRAGGGHEQVTTNYDPTWAARSIGGPVCEGPLTALVDIVVSRRASGWALCSLPVPVVPPPKPQPRNGMEPATVRTGVGVPPVHARGGRGLPTPFARFPVYSPGTRCGCAPPPTPASHYSQLPPLRALSPRGAIRAAHVPLARPSDGPGRGGRPAVGTPRAHPSSPRVTEKQKAEPLKYITSIRARGARWTAAAAAANSRPLPPSATSRSACLTHLLAFATGEGGRPSDRLR